MSSEKPLTPLTYWQWAGRILLACRVSVVSALAGLLLFAFVPQARDLFGDITYGPLPYSLFGWVMWLLFFAYVFLVWAFPVHYAARAVLERSDAWMIPARLRKALDDAPDCEGRVARELRRIREDMAGWLTWTPRVLGATPFLAVLIGLYKSSRVVADTQAALPASADAYWQIVVLTALDLVIGAGFVGFLLVRKKLFARSLGSSARLASFVALASALVISAAFFFSYFAPFYQAGLAPRALIVPFLFGSLVFIAAALAWASDLFGAPLLFLAIAAAFGVSAFNTHFNDLRELPGAPQNLAQRQIEIDDAVGKWKRANHCDGDGCPPALIVAAEGGASRAAFAAATALGEIFERAKELPDHADKPASPARRVFALSGVSGGAFGAATIRSALWESLERPDGEPPCRVAPDYWFGAKSAGAQERVRRDWRACLQALVSGDYLTAAFVGLGFRDNLSPPAYVFSGPSILQDDRAALVERAWESYFDTVLAGAKPWPWDASATKEPEAPTGLRRPFGYLAEELDTHEGAWLPVLMLNGTSVDRGVRILASDLVSTEPGTPRQGALGGRAPLYPAAFDLFEMLSTPCPPRAVDHDACADAHKGFDDVPSRRDGADVRLSTTAMLSARFPVVSPAGTIRAKGDDGDDGDRVVDGGYFENAGITTSLDIARALHDRGVTPILLWVQNDPTIDEDEIARPAAGDAPNARRHTNDATGRTPQFPPRAASTPRLRGAWPGWLSAVFATIAAPFDALAATRDGHALEAADLAQRRLQEMNAPSCDRNHCRLGASYFTFKMFKNPRFDDRPDAPPECKALAAKPRPIMSEVSMSWWLSQSVQAELDAQLCDRRNRDSLSDLQERLSQKLK